MGQDKYWRTDTARSYGFEAEFELDPAKTALLIVDMQCSDAHRDFGMGRMLKVRKPAFYEYFFNRLEQTVVPNNKRLLDFFRDHGLRVIQITVGPELPDWSDLSERRRRRLAFWMNESGPNPQAHKGTAEYAIIEPLKPREGELVIAKTTSSAFNSTGIERFLHNMGIDYLVITGVATDACVELTARDAADRGYNCVLVEDATATPDPEAHESTVKQYGRQSGRVLTTDEVIAELAQKLEALKVKAAVR